MSISSSGVRRERMCNISSIAPEHPKVQRRQIRSHTRRRRLHRLTLDLRLRARRALGLGARRAHRRRRALDFGAAGSRARRAFTRILFARRVIDNDRFLFRHGRLQHILRQVRRRRALRLQHVLAHIRAFHRRRYAAFQDILAHIGNRRASNLPADCTLLWSRHAFRLEAFG